MKHAQKYASKENNLDFRMLRRVFVDREAEEGRRKCKLVDYRFVANIDNNINNSR